MTAPAGRTLTMLHTAPGNVATFRAMTAELAPDVEVRHVLRADLLDAARAGGVTPALWARVAARIEETAADGADVVLCTCSSIGGAAEEAGAELGVTVLRVDRAMAEAAVAIGGTIGVAAALESTLAPTEDLLRQVAADAGADVNLHRILCTDAWPLLEAGDRDAFLASVAGSVRAGSAGCDVVVLAQASMAAAADLLADLPIPVLSSPRLGLEAALAMLSEPPTDSA